MGKRRKGAKSHEAPARSRIQEELSETFATAIALHRQGKLAEAETLYKAVLSIEPRHADALHMLGVMAHQVGQLQTAVEIIAAAIESNDAVAQYHFHLGVSLQGLNRLPEAADAYRRSTRLDPRFRAAWENLGVALQDSGDLDAAVDVYRRALKIDPGSKIARLNLGTLLNNRGHADEARGQFRELLALTPAYGEAHLKYASTSLLLGDLGEGWAHYAWRWHAESFLKFNPVRTIPYPVWDGSSLYGKALLINAEQGIGDEIMFASCFPDAIAAATHCVIECDPRLQPVFARSFPTASIVPRTTAGDFLWNDALPPIDVRVDAGSLPAVFRTTLDAFPDEPGFLAVDDARRRHWQERLAGLGPGPGPRLKVGITWRGGKEARGQRARSVPLALWRPILESGAAHFVDLQYGDHAEEVDAFNRDAAGELIAFDEIDPLIDIDEFLALVGALDLVISIDNSTVFMANAVGTPVWVMLPEAGEWRWPRHRARSPWCPGGELFWKRADEAWDAVIAEVAERLSQHAR